MADTCSSVSRRSFLGAAAMAAATVPLPATASLIPQRAWIVVEAAWEYNDDWSYPTEGVHPLGTVYFDRVTAEAECARLCEEFHSEQTPEEFGVDWETYITKEPESATWDELYAQGYPAPYSVMELATA